MTTPPMPAEAPTDRDDDRGWLRGLVLILLGGLFLAAQVFPQLDIWRFIPLVIGLAFLVAFIATRNYGFLVPGGILSGVGVGSLLSGLPAAAGSAGGLFLVSLGGGFLLIWLLGTALAVRGHHWWPLIPGGSLVLVGITNLGSGVARELLDLVGRGWPLLLIAAGLWVLLQATVLRRQAP